ncbi:MAG TPA: DUF3592 domain-containing protein [Trebonia sp.]|jgi:hypothetical protein|nr:DUF3592 domain-containing protein [Trebonia sp.]
MQSPAFSDAQQRDVAAVRRALDEVASFGTSIKLPLMTAAELFTLGALGHPVVDSGALSWWNAQADHETLIKMTYGYDLPMALATAVLAVGVIIGSVWYFAGVHSNAQASLAGGCTGLAVALWSGYYACGWYVVLLRWGRHMTTAPGTVRRFDDHAPAGGPGIHLSFKAAGGREDFWARAGSVPAGVGDTVTVYYDPARPAESATVQTAADVRARAIAATVAVLICLPLAVLVLVLVLASI